MAVASPRSTRGTGQASGDASGIVEVGIYTRISNADPATQTATHRQEEACRSFAAARGWTVVEVFEDVDVSAYSGVERPAYERMLRALDGGSLGGVVVWKLDRLVRRPREFERFWDACEGCGAVIASATEPMDSSTDVGLAVVRLLVVMATLESATKGARIAAAFKARAKRGQPPSGARGFGYMCGWQEFVPEEAALVREAADRVLGGETLSDIARDWCRRCIPSPKGAAAWRSGSMQHVVLNPRVAGLRTYHGEVVAQGDWPAILDDATFRRVEAILSDRTHRYETNVRGGKNTMGLLVRLIRCAKCGGRFNVFKRRTVSGPIAIYLCSRPPAGCMTVSVAMHLLDPWIMEKTFRYLDSKHLRDGLARCNDSEREPPDVGGLVRALDELAMDHYERQLLTPRQYEAKRRTLVRHLDQASASVNLDIRLPALAGFAGRGAELRERWPKMHLDECRAVAQAAINRITVAPADRSTRRHFQPERVRIKWRI